MSFQGVKAACDPCQKVGASKVSESETDECQEDEGSTWLGRTFKPLSKTVKSLARGLVYGSLPIVAGQVSNSSTTVMPSSTVGESIQTYIIIAFVALGLCLCSICNCLNDNSYSYAPRRRTREGTEDDVEMQARSGQDVSQTGQSN